MAKILRTTKLIVHRSRFIDSGGGPKGTDVTRWCYHIDEPVSGNRIATIYHPSGRLARIVARAMQEAEGGG